MARTSTTDGITEGLVCVLTAVEPCWSFEIYRNRDTKQLELEPRQRTCRFLYHDWNDPRWGFMHARMQSWFPCAIQVCLNGREWLARPLDTAGVRSVRQDNSQWRVSHWFDQ